MKAEEGTKYQYWYCYQAGSVEKSNTFAISGVFVDKKENNYLEREEAFAQSVQDVTQNGFNPGFEPQCYDYVDEERAVKHVKKRVERAERKKFDVLRINFSY